MIGQHNFPTILIASTTLWEHNLPIINYMYIINYVNALTVDNVTWRQRTASRQRSRSGSARKGSPSRRWPLPPRSAVQTKIVLVFFAPLLNAFSFLRIAWYATIIVQYDYNYDNKVSVCLSVSLSVCRYVCMYEIIINHPNTISHVR